MIEYSGVTGLDFRRLIEVYEKAITIGSGNHQTTVNELTDQIPATRPYIIEAALSALIAMGPVVGTKVLAEEDKGAVLAGMFAVYAGLPLAMARIYSYRLPNSVCVPISMEYYDGVLHVNGIAEGDEIVIIDDTLSTGGTVLALAKAVKSVGARIVEVRVVVEKLGFGGRSRLEDELGVPVRAAIGIRLANGRVLVEEVMETPRVVRS